MHARIVYYPDFRLFILGVHRLAAYVHFPIGVIVLAIDRLDVFGQMVIRNAEVRIPPAVPALIIASVVTTAAVDWKVPV